MRPIKFRGKSLRTGEYHYGYYSECLVGNGRVNSYITDKNLDSWVVKPETVAQFVGYDKHGKEIYSDDTVVNVYGAEIPFSAVMISYEDIGKKFTNLRLKGAKKK